MINLNVMKKIFTICKKIKIQKQANNKKIIAYIGKNMSKYMKKIMIILFKHIL